MSGSGRARELPVAYITGRAQHPPLAFLRARAAEHRETDTRGLFYNEASELWEMVRLVDVSDYVEPEDTGA